MSLLTPMYATLVHSVDLESNDATVAVSIPPALKDISSRDEHDNINSTLVHMTSKHFNFFNNTGML